jgi:hypothetical protein
MRNIHILPTDKPSRLVKNLQYNTFWLRTDYIDREVKRGVEELQYQNIYITNDEIVTEYLTGLYFIDIDTGRNDIFSPIYINKETIAAGKFHTYMNNGSMCKKIIMTTDPQLIADGVQPIPDEFLEWFVKNPSCESVEVAELKCTGQCWKFIESDYEETCLSGCEKIEYKIIIPKEENKVLVEMQQILKKDSKIMGHYESCDLCHYNAFFKYLYNGEILYRCQGHKIVDINNLKSKFGFGSNEPKQETLEEAARKYANITHNRPLDEEERYYKDYQKHDGFIEGAKWQQEQIYNQIKGLYDNENITGFSKRAYAQCLDIVEQFKNK